MEQRIRNITILYKINFVLCVRNNVLLSVIILCFIPLVHGISNLNKVFSAQCLEGFVSILGIVLLVPILRPEQNREINEVVSSKAKSQYRIFFFRLVMAILCMIILISMFAGIMKFFYCKFPYFFYVFGTFCSAFALGCAGLFTAALINNTIVGYLVSITYLLLDMYTKDRYLGVFTLSSMQLKNYQNKYWLLVLGIILVTGTMFVRKLKSLR